MSPVVKHELLLLLGVLVATKTKLGDIKWLINNAETTFANMVGPGTMSSRLPASPTLTYSLQTTLEETEKGF